jgi:RNA polymerase sigma-70 factor, ECF subfamily
MNATVGHPSPAHTVLSQSMQLERQADLLALRPRIYRFCLSFLRNPQDAQDLTQDTLLRAFDRFESYNPTYDLGRWVLQIARNLCINHLRCQRRGRFILSLDAPSPDFEDLPLSEVLRAGPSTDPESLILAQALDDRIKLALRTLHPRHRSILELVAAGLGYEEVASRLGCSINTVRSGLHRGRERLRAFLKEE